MTQYNDNNHLVNANFDISTKIPKIVEDIVDIEGFWIKKEEYDTLQNLNFPKFGYSSDENGNPVMQTFPKEFSWKEDEQIIISGIEFGMYKLLTEMVLNSPEAQKIMTALECNKNIQNKIKEGIDKGWIK